MTMREEIETTAAVDPELLTVLGEHFAAGFFEWPEALVVTRLARGLRRHLETAVPATWQGGPLYPSGAHTLWQQGAAIYFHYSHSLCWDRAGLQRLQREHPEAETTLAVVEDCLAAYPMVGSQVPPEFRLGGDGYTHSIPNYGRICCEGLAAYEDRVAAHLAQARRLGDPDRAAFYEAMQEMLDGIRAWHGRCLAEVKNAPASGPLAAVRDRLVAALEQVPFGPARSFYEAMVATNLVFYLDGCDSLGRFDQVLNPFYVADLAAGRIDEAEAVERVRLLWENVDANSGWNVALAGSTASGEPADNPLTRVCLKAAVAIRRPNLALRLRRDTAEEVFDLALDAIASGCGIPALYHEEAYLAALRQAHLNLRQEDLADFAFGGCTETMVHGKSNVGSLDAGINLVHHLGRVLEAELATAPDFASLWAAYREELRQAVARLVEGVNRDQELKARHQPQPLRSLLIDDCLDAGTEYNAGGARYNWSVVNVGGLANVADSLAAMRAVVFEQGEVTGAALLAALRADFVGHEPLRRRLESCPRFGNDQPEADELAVEVAAFVFGELRRYAPWRGGRFLPGCLMFVTYAGAGEGVMATPDGRRAGTPIADSAGPVQGRDRSGPTAMIRSVTRISHWLAPGTLVVNARFGRSMFSTPAQRTRLKDLIRTYFSLGGMQLQINVVDQAVLRDAIAHPEQHGDLIVRVGGYSEYFNRLSPALKESLLERTEHTC